MLVDRRTLLALVAGGLTTPAFGQGGMSKVTAFAFSFPGLAGSDIRLADHAGKPILVVNTASLCGYTPQLAGCSSSGPAFMGAGS
jgi:glutathione peroxidase